MIREPWRQSTCSAPGKEDDRRLRHALGGLDTLVFAGGIGENAPAIRARICDRLDFLGITIDPTQNAARAALISHASAGVAVRVIATDEEQMIATLVSRVLGSA